MSDETTETPGSMPEMDDLADLVEFARKRGWKLLVIDPQAETITLHLPELPPQFNPTRQARRARRKAKEAGTGGNVTAEEWRSLCAQHDHRCAACGERRPLSVDHIVPLSLGGTSDISNLQPLCEECNSLKGHQAIDYRRKKEQGGTPCPPANRHRPM